MAGSKADLMAMTPLWKGDRYPDGRPKVAEDLLKRLKAISIEEAWDVLRLRGYENQFASGLADDPPGSALRGTRARRGLPPRPAGPRSTHVMRTGKEEGRIGPSNSWPIDMLQQGDVYIADGCGKVADGTLIGDNLGNAIYAKTHTGVVFDAGARDLDGLKKIEGFNAFVRGWDPTFLKNMVLSSINRPIRIGSVTVLPGDVILARREGVIVIPPHLAEEVVVTAEIVALKDEFGHIRLTRGSLHAGQIDVKWTARSRPTSSSGSARDPRSRRSRTSRSRRSFDLDYTLEPERIGGFARRRSRPRRAPSSRRRCPVATSTLRADLDARRPFAELLDHVRDAEFPPLVVPADLQVRDGVGDLGHVHLGLDVREFLEGFGDPRQRPSQSFHSAAWSSFR